MYEDEEQKAIKRGKRHAMSRHAFTHLNLICQNRRRNNVAFDLHVLKLKKIGISKHMHFFCMKHTPHICPASEDPRQVKLLKNFA